MNTILGKLGGWWKSIRQWYQLLQPARACLLASILVPVLFSCVDQGRDTLRLVASEGFSWHTFWMMVAMWVAGLASWAWARLLLNFDFPKYDEAREISEGGPEAEARAETGRCILRRVCGLLPPVGVGVGFLFAADNSGDIPQCLVLAVVSFGVGIGLWFCFERLKRCHESLTRGLRIPRFRNLADVRSDTFTKWAILLTWAVSAIIFAALTGWPVVFGEALGSPAVILFAIAVWISVGSVLIYAANLHRVPLFAVLLLWVAVCSFFNDNHAIRTLQAGCGNKPAPAVINALDEWHDQVTKQYPLKDSQQMRPLYLVAAAGGGIRAAYWTAIVLGRLEECARSNGTSFAAHTFAMSGVSGGSLGEVTFAALLAHDPSNGTNYTGIARKLLAYDFLAADVARMAFADFLQMFLPFPIRHFDRARGLEDAWSAAWRDTLHTNVLEESIEQLYSDASAAKILLPHLLLNGTCVETGQRVITSDMAIRARVKENGKTDSNGNFLDAIVAADKLSHKPIRLSTAAHQSARFTYFSPAGRFPDGTHIVDGGYFENSGASTLMDLLSAIQWRIRTKCWTDVDPRLILINNDPIPLRPATTKVRFLRETLSPIRALLNTRTARGDYAMEQALNYDWKAAKIYQFDLYGRVEDEPLGKCKVPGELPLGWTLSSCAMDEMDAQLALPFQRATNSVTISKIIAALPRCSPCGRESNCREWAARGTGN